MVTQEKLLTADEFWQTYAGQRVELVKGVPVEMAPTSMSHGMVALRIGAYVYNYVTEHDLGVAMGAETGFLVSRDPDVLRAADLAFVDKGRAASVDDEHKFIPFPPDLAVEVISPSDRAGSIQEKIDDYLEAGVRLLWVIYPQTQKVVVHTPDGRAVTLGIGDTLTGGEVLPGFELPLVKLFPAD
jgi:Uma2 family endonuclease